jgi:dTDP-4-dehydrorhamnose reductase|tara:strand:- start:1021 stop:1899 length:879 start_codon:yes stop_codon:yes gene_type:complete
MRVLMLGANGQLGRCLADQLMGANHETILTSRSEIDITDFSATRVKISQINPDVVINASAYTGVDDAESKTQKADLVNHLAVANIAYICADIESVLIHISTDYVFDGEASAAYGEEAQTNPQGVYGKTKLLGDIAIQQSGCKHLIIRTAWVFSEYGNNFMKTMLRLGAERDELSIVGDQIGCPTYAQDLARAIVAMLPKVESNQWQYGVYHYCGDSACSWYEFAEAIFKQAKECGFKVPNRINSITTVDYPTPAKRPAYSVLDCSTITTAFDITASNWRQGIVDVLNRLDSK